MKNYYYEKTSYFKFLNVLIYFTPGIGNPETGECPLKLLLPEHLLVLSHHKPQRSSPFNIGMINKRFR
jgi:hypothetical protein